jgi:hypothetical protein
MINLYLQCRKAFVWIIIIPHLSHPPVKWRQRDTTQYFTSQILECVNILCASLVSCPFVVHPLPVSHSTYNFAYRRADNSRPVSFTVSAWEWVYATNLSRPQRETTKRHVGEAHSVLTTNEQTPWPESASELYQPSDRRVSAKLVPTFADRGVSRSQSGGSLTAVISVF